jgi:cobaltochelatase CobN
MSSQPPAERKRIAMLLPSVAAVDDAAVAELMLNLDELISMLQEAGYRIDAVAGDEKALLQRLNTAADAGPAAQTLSFADYQIDFAALPAVVQQKTLDHYGPAETDPYYRPGELDCGRFVLPVLWLGDIVIGRWPVRADDDDPNAPLAHADLAFYFWLKQEAEVKVLIDLAHPERPGHPFAALTR